jgi:nucleoside-diphosphate kinase
MERTLVVLKPDAVQRRLIGSIVERLERKGLTVVGMKMLTMEPERARRMYAVHEGKDFYPRLLAFMTSSPVVALVLEGKDAVGVTRSLMGPTFGPDAPPGTIRGDFGMSRRYNLVHGSDSPESAQREIGVLFESHELQQYNVSGRDWVYDLTGAEPI